MKTKNNYKSDAFEAIHGAIAGMYKAGTINEETMRSFDEFCLLMLVPIEPPQITTKN